MIRCESTKKHILEWKGGLLMEQIIYQIVTGYVKKYVGYTEKNGIKDLGTVASDFLLLAKGMALEILGEFVAEADRTIVEAKVERRKNGTSIHERRVPRSIYTALGEFTYERTYFSTPEGKAYLLDRLIGVEPYERVDTTVSAAMVNRSSEMSFGKSAAIVTGGAVSRQTAHRKAMKTADVAYVPERAEKTPETLHIFADEDHVHMQSGRSSILPLMTVCGGKLPVCKGRNELVSPVHLNGYGRKPEKNWDHVYAVCAQMYDMDEVKQVFIYGDDAAWIDRAKEFFPGCVQVLDAYHYRKRMRSLASGDICSMHRDSMRRSDRTTWRGFRRRSGK
jgi:hypothetical protein